MKLNTEQEKLAKAIHADFAKTYPDCTLQMVTDEMEYQMETGDASRMGILSTWIEDYLQRAGYWDSEQLTIPA